LLQIDLFWSKKAPFLPKTELYIIISTFKIKVEMELWKTKLKATLENEPKIEIVCVDALIYGRISDRAI
jgi:hypothetical protein